MISWCGSQPALRPFSANCRRCATPKRCCSSMMTSPSRANCTLSWNSAWVPMTSWQLASARLASEVVLDLAVCLPESHPTEMPRGSNQLRKRRRCCSASISVGAMMATCRPAASAGQAASAATTVLPAPTSPCTSLSMTRVWPRSR